MFSPRLLSASLIASLALVGCQSTTPVAPQTSVAPKPRPVETPVAKKNVKPQKLALARRVGGYWQGKNPDGTNQSFQALFRNGSFVSYRNGDRDPNNLLSKGTYKARGASAVFLDFTGTQSGRNSATCREITSKRMQCTLANGSVFFLEKISSNA